MTQDDSVATVHGIIIKRHQASMWMIHPKSSFREEDFEIFKS